MPEDFFRGRLHVVLQSHVFDGFSVVYHVARAWIVIARLSHRPHTHVQLGMADVKALEFIVGIDEAFLGDQEGAVIVSGEAHVEEFEIIFNNLSLEEVIGLKLELASKSAFKGKLYGVPLWYSIPNIVRDAVLKYALSATRSKREAARFLGLNELAMKKNINRYRIDDYFEKELDKEDNTS